MDASHTFFTWQHRRAIQSPQFQSGRTIRVTNSVQNFKYDQILPCCFWVMVLKDDITAKLTFVLLANKMSSLHQLSIRLYHRYSSSKHRYRFIITANSVINHHVFKDVCRFATTSAIFSCLFIIIIISMTRDDISLVPTKKQKVIV